MKIIQKILIKQTITEKSKRKLFTTFNKEKIQLEKECQQLLFEQKKIAKTKRTDATSRFELEIKKRQDKIAVIDFKIEQLEILELGSEIVEKEAEALVNVKVGSNWENLHTEKAIIIKDGIVIRIDG